MRAAALVPLRHGSSASWRTRPAPRRQRTPAGREQAQGSRPVHVKTPKLHFLDSGLVCWLLGIQSAAQLRDHPLRGAVFETWVASEVLKAPLHRGLPANLAFYRDRGGAEVDLIVELARSYLAIETRSGQIVAEDFFTGLRTFVAAARADAALIASSRLFPLHAGETQALQVAAEEGPTCFSPITLPPGSTACPFTAP